MATVRHTVPDTTDAFDIILLFFFTLDTREEYALGWSLAGFDGMFNGWNGYWRYIPGVRGFLWLVRAAWDLAPPRYILVMLA